jgi:hypothetical protein
MKALPVASKLLSSVLFAFVLAAHQCVMAGVNLQVTIETHNVPNQGSSNTPTDTQDSLDVTLADGYISVKTPREAQIFDFKLRRRIVLNSVTKTYVDFSLYDVVGFRAVEFRNREMLHGALSAAKIPGAPFSMIDNEHVLSVHSATSAKIDETTNNGEVIFSSGDHQLARWSEAGFNMSPADLARFANFVRYQLGGHPQILKMLAAGKSIPNKLIFTFNEAWGTSVRSIAITTAHQLDPASYDLSSYSKQSVARPPNLLDEILDQATSASSKSIEVAKENNRTAQASDFRDAQLVDALLGSIEWTLMTGQQFSPFSTEQLSKIRADPSVQKLTGAIGANTKDAMKDAVQTLVDLRSHAPKKTYVLKIFEANDRLRLGEQDAAKALFTEVLQSNPFLAGVYKDLGDLLLMQYDTPRAWRCWDLGRHLAPQFANFAAVSEFEKSLAEQQPEYF